jgi:hypothetical protein
MRRLLVLLPVLAALQACSGNDDAPVASANLAMVNGAGAEIDPTATGSQTGYAVAFDGSSYLVVWSASRDGSLSDILAARVGPDGARLDAAPIVVSGAAGDQVLPDVAFDGTNYLVVWQDQRAGGDKNIHAARVSPAGVVLDPASIAIAEPGNQLNPEVAFLGTSFLVVWEDTRNTLSDVYAARITLDGVRGPAFPLSTAAGHQVQPAVGCGLDTCLATWRDGRNGGPDVYGARITADGVVDLDGLAISRASSSQGTPAVASDGTDFLVAWSDTRNGTSDVYGARVGRDGLVRDPNGLAIARAPEAQQATAAAFEGVHYVVAWEDRRSGTGFEVYGARVSPGGAVLDPDGFQIEPGTAGTRVALDSNRAGRALVASDGREVVDPLLGTSIARLRTRIVTTRAILTVSRVGNGSGTVTSAPAGIDCGEICSSFFDAPTDVALTPVPAAGSAFVSWSGACTGSGPCTVTVDDARSVTAKFSPYHLLTVTRSGAPGTVVSTPAGIDCGEGCAAEFVEETVVALTPVPGANSLFGSWTGPCAPTVLVWDPLNPAPCHVRIDAATAVDANFRPAHKLTVNATGTAAGRVDGSTWPIHCATGSAEGCSSMVFASETVTLTATPAEGAILKSWSGCSASSGNSCTVTVYSARTVTATFQPAFYTLTLASTGGGGGAMAGDGMTCDVASGVRCTFQVANGGSAEVTVTADEASLFKSWTGCSSVSGATCTVSMSGARTITANVQPSTYLLTATAGGTGKGTVTGPDIACASGSTAGCSAPVPNGELVTLEATPDAESIVKYWTGCTSWSGTTCTVSMTLAKSVTAVFQPSHYLLSVNSTGGGGGTVFSEGFTCTAVSGVPCTTLVPNGATPTYTASADTSSIFKGWTGCGSASGESCSVTMSGPRTITVTLQPSTYPLTIVSSGSGTVEGAGLTCSEATPEACDGPVANGETVTLEAYPAADWILKSWSGCTSSSGTTCTVAMTAARKVTALFQPATYLLTANVVGSGTGTVAGAGIVCATGSPEGCSARVANGATVTLTAAPSETSVFKGWIGCSSVSGTACSVSMTLAKTVTATFQPAFYPLTTAFSGGGGGVVASADGAVSCATSTVAPCTTSVANGATVTLTATPDAESVFKYWTGCTSTSGATCTVSMTLAKTVTAVIQPSTYALGVVATGTASGSVEGPGIACATGSTGGCSAPVANGASVTLTAIPAEGAILKSWMGCSSSSGASCTVAMTMAKTVTATFQPAVYPLTLASSGGGGGIIASADGALSCVTGPGVSCSADVANGAALTLTATPDAQSVFKSWTGCTSTSGTTCTISMTSAKTATAVFQPSTYLLTAVTSGAAAGRIDGGAIACATGSTEGCTAELANGATVSLVATPGPDAIFKGWTGCTSISGTTCNVTMSSAKTASATFQPGSYLLTASAVGTAGGTIEGAGLLCATGSSEGCTAMVANGAAVSLVANPEAGAILKTWSGCSSVSGTTCNVTMWGARAVIATFQPSTYLLAVTSSGTGTGTVTGPGISCTSGSSEGCGADVANGATVTLTATPDEGTVFRGWYGCSTMSGTTCNVTMYGAKTVTALF